jgi:hypothetical protein
MQPSHRRPTHSARGSAKQRPTVTLPRKVLAVALLLSALTGCTRTLAFILVRDLRCFEAPGEYVPGTSLESGGANFISAHLRELGEPVLWETALAPRTTIRLTAAPPRGKPIAVRFEYFSKDKIRVHAARSNLLAGACPPSLRPLDRWFQDEDAEADLSLEQWSDLIRLLLASEFDMQPLLEPIARIDDQEVLVVRTDGGSYFLEQREREGYRGVLRPSASPFIESAAFRNLCNRMLELSPLPEDPSDPVCPES